MAHRGSDGQRRDQVVPSGEDTDMKERAPFAVIARTSMEVAATSSRRAKVDLLAASLGSLAPEEVPIAVAYLSGALPQGSIGVGWAAIRDVPRPRPDAPTLELLEVDDTLRRVGGLTSPGSQAARRAELHDLFARATEPEQRFLRGLLMGEIRQGALQGLVVDAVARAAGVPLADVRRAAMLAGDLGSVAAAAIAGGAEALSAIHLSPLTPVQPMLAQSAGDVASALERIHP